MRKRKVLFIFTLSFLIMLLSSQGVMAAPIYGDLNGDNLVDIKDLGIMSQFYNASKPEYDLNRDGIIDIYDITSLGTNMVSYTYKLYDSNGYFKRGFESGRLLDATNSASQQKHMVIDDKGNLVWDNSAYYLFNGETYLQRCSNLYQAAVRGDATDNAMVLDKNGQAFINKAQGYRAVLGKAQDELWLRSAPHSTIYTIILNVPFEGTVEITERLKDFYKVKYYNPNDKKIYEGYIKRRGAYGANLIDSFTDNYNGDLLGYISEIYESNGDPGAISSGVGDAGGVSYGAFQFSTKTGSLADFVLWLKGQNINFYNQLNNAFIQDGGTYGTNFNAVWKSLGQNNYNEFYNLQHYHIKIKFYDVMIKKLKDTGVDYTSRLNSFAVRNMLWSIAVQHGQTGGFNLVKQFSGVTNDINFIDAVYDERSLVEKYFSSSSTAVQQSVKARFVKERAYVKRVYNYETSQ